MKLDRTDRRILAVMQANGRITTLELAEQVGLSPTPCARRVRRLEESGVITRHVTLLDQKRLGLNITAMIGITMGEIFYLKDLAEDCAKDKVYEFFFTAPPLPITGAVGSPINPQAIK